RGRAGTGRLWRTLVQLLRGSAQGEREQQAKNSLAVHWDSSRHGTRSRKATATACSAPSAERPRYATTLPYKRRARKPRKEVTPAAYIGLLISARRTAAACRVRC